MCRFITLAESLIIYENQIREYGGQFGIRDIYLLISALSVVQSTYEGEYLHKDIFEMAGAYAFHICQNHPFIDGNKRTALATALVFLDINGIEVIDEKSELYKLMMEAAKGNSSKSSIARTLKKIVNEEVNYSELTSQVSC
jgi:death-on-curing protein